MSIRPRDRFLTFRRDKFTCQYCGRTPPEIKLECDHVQARAKGGSDDIGNLITSCRECNIGKRTTDVIAPTKEPISSCHICEGDLYEGDDYEGWDTDDICRGCVEVIHAECNARHAAENAEINAWIAARGAR